MNLDCVRKGLTNYGFIELFSAITILERKNVAFSNKELEKDLFEYVDDGKYRHLFFNLDKDYSDKKLKLNDAFDYGYSFGILTKISEEHGVHSMISLDCDEVNRIISKYQDEYSSEIKAMHKLINEYHDKKLNENKLVNVYVKK